MSFIALLPARAASTRLPGKPLADVGGKPMIVRVAEQAARSQASRVVVATDAPAIVQAVQAHGFEALLTSPDHATGTDRLAEAAGALALPGDAIVVNVQGDEPLIDPALIDAVAALLAARPDAAIATCAAPIDKAETLFDPNVVKLVCTQDARAMYFSRAPIPWARDALAQGERILAAGLPVWRHIGLYAYRCRFLYQFPALSQGALERYEMLEQLRALEHGHCIVVHCSNEMPAPGVDTEQDLARIRAIYAANRL